MCFFQIHPILEQKPEDFYWSVFLGKVSQLSSKPLELMVIRLQVMLSPLLSILNSPDPIPLLV